MSAPGPGPDPLRYCEELVAPAGSTAYYSLLFTPPDQQADLLAIQAWRLELAGVLSECSDLTVARRKLAWWGEELSRTVGGEPRHPITRALRVLAEDPQVRRSLARMLAATAGRLEPRVAATFADLEDYCEQTAGEGGRLSARLGGVSGEEDVGAASRLAVAAELATVLHTTPRDRLGRMRLLPLEELRRAGVNLVDFEARTTSPALRDWLAAHGERVRRRLDEAMAEIPRQHRYAQHQALIAATIARAQLAALARAHYWVLERPPRVTPLRKLWIAWRVHRRAKARDDYSGADR